MLGVFLGYQYDKLVIITLFLILFAIKYIHTHTHTHVHVCVYIHASPLHFPVVYHRPNRD